MARRPVILVIALAVLAVLVAIPVLAQSPSTGPGNSESARGNKVAKTPITLTGTISATTDATGKTSYTLRSGGTTYQLDAGPEWFFGDAHPLKAYAGESVTVRGERAEGSTDVEVETVDGKRLRESGKPPWAGGWKVVGERHPGWSQEKADRFKAKFGDCFPPGQCKDKPGASAAP